MNAKTRESLSKVGKLVGEQKHDPRAKFARAKEAVEIYHVSRPTLMRMAIDSGALYKVNATVLINLEILDDYLETFRIPGEML